MTQNQISSNFPKSRPLVFLEYLLFAACLAVIALRTTFTEGLTAQSLTQPINIGDNAYSLSVSAVLILSFVLWLVCSVLSGRFSCRLSAIEIGLGLFCAAAVIAGFAAANKRAAITNSIVLIAPVLMAVLLVQIMDSQAKVKLLLCVVAALGLVSAWQCSEQFFSSNQAMIDQYRQAPETILGPLGIKPGSFQQMLLEHSLYSKDIRGFFTTGNSAGCFAMLASFAAIALFIDKFKNRKSEPPANRGLVTCGLALVIILAGLILTHSKGAIAASVIAAALFIIYLLFATWLKAHRKVILAGVLLAGFAGLYTIVSYGLAHGRLPGGNSMLVRWQYWCTSARMFTDHWLTGIGPGNFAHFYTHYKPAAALETVSDPHSFPLSILTQFGPLGLIGFLAMILLPLWRVSFAARHSLPNIDQTKPASKKLAICLAIVISLALLLIRPLIIPLTIDARADVMLYIRFVLYIAPVAIFIVGFLLLVPAVKTDKTTIVTAALFCACLGVLFHNLIDFAIFEPGVSTVFWAIIAALVAADANQNKRPHLLLRPKPFARVLIAIAGVIAIGAYFHYALIPIAKTCAKTKLAMRLMQAGAYPHQLLHDAAKNDPLDPAPVNLNGRLYLQHYNETSPKQPGLLNQAAACFMIAARRDKADFKNYQKLAEVYNLLAQCQTKSPKTYWLEEAFDYARNAIELYPGSGRLRIELAETAEKLDRTGAAIEQYKKAVEIEDAYRSQFRIMYPKAKMFSRLGQEEYQLAKQRIEQLSKKQAQ